MEQDLTRTPFSRFGSYLTLKRYDAENPRKPAGIKPGLWIGGVHGFHGAREIFRVGLWRDGKELSCAATVHPSHLTLHAEDDGRADLCLAEPDLLRLRCRGAELRLVLNDGSHFIPQDGGRVLLNTARAFLCHTACPVAGTMRMIGTGDSHGENIALSLAPDGDGPAEAALYQHVGFAKPSAPRRPFDGAVAGVRSEFEQFAAPYRNLPPEWAATAEQAASLNWSCVVSPRGHFRRPSMLMSKNWMCNVWSWDHAINALALGAGHPELAWDQLLTIFDHQLPTGQLPDFVNDTGILYNFVKPPIHGWILRRLMERNAWFTDRERLAAFYEPLTRWTEWWFSFRLRADAGLPEYYHGNDCGWDNCTVFDVGLPVIAADCAAFLVLQMEALADVASRLGRDDEAVAWRERADDLSRRLMRLWDGRRFRVLNRDGRFTERSDSLFGCLPIILGDRLPAGVRAALVSEIRRHLTEWGLATEHPRAPLYEPDGYWRGPIWAPPTLIVTDGLRAAGEDELADEIAVRFCRLCRRSGFAENYDAVTGAGLRDPAYTWTASVFLLLAGDLAAVSRERASRAR